MNRDASMIEEVKLLTVGSLIDYLGGLDTNTIVPLSLEFGSYRGFYEHVYIAPGESSAKDLRNLLTSQLYTTMHGYKGGKFTFQESCEVYLAEYGVTGSRLGLVNNKLVTIENLW